MVSKTTAALLAALSLSVSGPAAAQSAGALSLAGSPAAQRAGVDMDEASQLRGPGLWIAGAVVLGLIVWGIIELTDNEEAFPVSS
jgi:hypothetical protein